MSTRTGPPRPRRRRWLVWFLALCVVWTLGVIAWAAVALLTPAGDSSEEAVERKAGMHHDQHQPAGRYYVPTYARVEKDGTAVLRYEVGNGQDSSVKDFLRTYDITAKPKRTSPSKVTYADRFGDVRRTFTITYNPSPEPGGYDYARITVRAIGTDAN
ncbi:MAG: hypothetical protein HOZ81_47700 [Streptomyces sp.]|nr:hypothetical protein [Streptomyces sp.]NUT29321.1 hypothetical protein [Streptomyces sp.]